MPKHRRRRKGVAKKWSRPKQKKSILWQDALKNIYTSIGEADALSSSPSRLQKQLLSRYNISNVSREQISDWLDHQFSHSIHKKASTHFKRNPIIAPDMDYQWQADLLFLDDLARFNDGNKILFVAIDVVSRFMWVEPMKNKTGASTTAAFESILRRAKPRKPQKLQTDKGTEFLNSTFQSMLHHRNIEFFTTYSDTKAAIAERSIQTLKVLIYKYLKEINSNRFLDHLQNIVSTYNLTFHSSIKYAPADVSSDNVHEVLNNLYGFLWEADALNNPKPRFKIGDYVRVSKIHSHIFRKGYKGYWSDEIFQIISIKNTVPRVTYGIKDLKGNIIMGSYYENEIQKIPSESLQHQYWNVDKILQTKTVAGKKMFFVKWEGHDDTHNSWISADQFKQAKV